MNIFWMLVGIGLSYILIRYRKQIIDFTGTWGWAERYLGSGGSYTAVVFMAIGLFFLSITLATGGFDDFGSGGVGKFFGGGN